MRVYVGLNSVSADEQDKSTETIVLAASCRGRHRIIVASDDGKTLHEVKLRDLRAWATATGNSKRNPYVPNETPAVPTVEVMGDPKPITVVHATVTPPEGARLLKKSGHRKTA